MKLSVMNIVRSKNNYSEIVEWPTVTIVFSVFNEEKVIKRKLESILNSDYPKDKLQILIGSDHSTDQTHQIIEEFISQNLNIRFIKKETRSGKLKIINELFFSYTFFIVFIGSNIQLRDFSMVYEISNTEYCSCKK